MSTGRTEYADVGLHSLRWSSATVAAPGGRRNEDSVLCAPGIFVVADGMGGLGDGDVASAIAVSYLADLAVGDEDGPRSLDALTVTCQAIDRSVVREAARQGGRMGTTVVGMLLVEHDSGTAPAIFHLGDSRAYVRADGALTRLTEDHVQFESSPDLADNTARPRLTRYLGAGGDDSPDIAVIGCGPARVLLASDGVHAVVPETLIERTMAGAPLPEDVVDALISAADAHGRCDDASIVVVDLAPRSRPRR